MVVLESISAVDVQTGLVGVTTFLFTKWLLSGKSPKRMPRGPPRLPFVGNALTFRKNDFLHIQLDEWAQEYGDIYTVQLGRYEMIVVSSEVALRELMVNKGEQTSYRSRLFLHWLLDATRGIVNNMGASWREQRRTAVTALRDFGVGKITIEQRILEEADRIISRLDENLDRPIELQTHFINASTNIICSIIFGERYDYQDKEFVYLLDTLQFMFSQGGLKNVGLYFPEIFIVAPFLLPVLLVVLRFVRRLEKFFMRKIQEHRTSFDQNNIRDFMDLYIQAEQSAADKSIHSEKQLLSTILDLFAAGSETTATTLRWCLLYLVRDTDVQDKVRSEILQVIGDGRQPAYSDHSGMPYTEAVIEETLRLGNIAPHTLPHTTSELVEYRDYLIPAGTMVTGNMYTIHRDPANFPEPLEFRPERWIDHRGHFTKHHSFFAFGLGPRECPGKSLAYQEIFLLLTSLIQQFRFTAFDPDNLPSTAGRLGLTHSPTDYSMRAERL